MTDEAGAPAADAVAAQYEQLAHRLYFDERSPLQGLMLWRVRARTGAPTLDSQLGLAHCEIEQWQDFDLPEIGVRVPDAPDAGQARRYAGLVIECALAHLTAGDHLRASKLARLAAAVDPHLRSVYERHILAPRTAAGDARPAAADTGALLPCEAGRRLDDAAARALVAPYAGRRALMLYPKPADAWDIPVTRQMRHALEAVGLEVTLVDSMPLDPAVGRALAPTLRRAIATLQPAVIVAFDAGVSGATADPAIGPELLAILAGARREAGSRVICSYSDPWYEGCLPVLEALAPWADLLHLPTASLNPLLSPAAAARTFCYPYPLEDQPAARASAAPPVPGRAAFVGGVGWVNLSRLAWCAEIARAGLPVDIHLTGGAGAHLFRSAADYAALIGRYPACVNFGARLNGRSIATGRAVETPFFGSLLLEQSNPDTCWFLRPHEHYLPFDSLAELADRLADVLGNPARYAAIAEAGRAWSRRQFAPLHFWARLFQRLAELPAPAGTHGGAPLAPVRFPHSAATYLEMARALV